MTVLPFTATGTLVSKLKILKWGVCPGWSRQAQCNWNSLHKEVDKRIREEGKRCEGGKVAVVCFIDGEEVMSQRMLAVSRRWERQERQIAGKHITVPEKGRA